MRSVAEKDATKFVFEDGRKLCAECSNRELGVVVERISTGVCKCCGKKKIIWERLEDREWNKRTGLFL